jgi:hypothetical protein
MPPPSSCRPANPFAKPSTLPFQYPAFDKIKNEDFAPAFEQGMRQQSAEIDAIANNKKPRHLRQHHRRDGAFGPVAEPRLDRVRQPVRRQYQRHLQRAGRSWRPSWPRTAMRSA